MKTALIILLLPLSLAAQFFDGNARRIQGRPINCGTPTDGQVLVYSTTTNRWNCGAGGGSPTGAAGGALSGTYPNPTQDIALTLSIDGAGSTITTGIKGRTQAKFACTIADWTILSDVSGDAVLDIWKDTYANYPPTVADTITAAAKPTLTGATKATGSPTGWTTAIAVGDTIIVNLDSVATVTYLQLVIKCTRG